MSCYLVQEVDGSGRFLLEDGSGFLMLENCVPSVTDQPDVGGPLRKGRRRLHDVVSEDEWLAVVLGEV